MQAIDIRDLSRSYGSRRGINNINLTIAEGESNEGNTDQLDKCEEPFSCQ